MRFLVLFHIVFAVGMLNAHADGLLIEDRQIEALPVFPIEKVGAFGRMVQANKLKLRKDCFSVGDVIDDLGFEKGVGVTTEQDSAMRWAVHRVGISKSYEIWIQCELVGIGKEHVFVASIPPYAKGKLGEVLADPEKWKKMGVNKKGDVVRFESQDEDEPAINGNLKGAIDRWNKASIGESNDWEPSLKK
jgi:hypothetical protein